MTDVKTPAPAFRHYCSSSSGWTRSCTKTHEGKARRSHCKCNAPFVQESGYWGVFVWSRGNHYPMADAVSIHGTEYLAQRRADKGFEQNHVVRWIAA